ncbi:MAG: ATP-binding protein [Gemmatimonadetes bacterium]|nr:ATP-binding protein [Gemmatimonadota bacterium]
MRWSPAISVPLLLASVEPVRRLVSAPAGSFALLGPHGSGKSYWVRREFPHALLVDLEEPAIARRLRARPDALEAIVGPRPNGEPVVIDGVERAPGVADAARRIGARDKRWRFILVASSARALPRDRLGLFGRRFARVRMRPFVGAEMGRRFHVAEATRLGTVPAILDDPRPVLARADYYTYFFRREVKAERLVPDFERYGRFLDVIASAHAAQLDVARLARACALDRRLVAGYLAMLEERFLIERLEPFTRRARRALFTQPKLYVFDAGVYRALPPDDDQPAEEVESAALEGLVYQHLSAWCSWAPGAQRTIGFWRTSAGAKVDFVVQSRDEFVAIDVHDGFDPGDDALAGAIAFRADYPTGRAIVLHRGTERSERRGVLCLPIDDFLTRLHPARSVSVAARQG